MSCDVHASIASHIMPESVGVSSESNGTFLNQ